MRKRVKSKLLCKFPFDRQHGPETGRMVGKSGKSPCRSPSRTNDHVVKEQVCQGAFASYPRFAPVFHVLLDCFLQAKNAEKCKKKYIGLPAQDLRFQSGGRGRLDRGESVSQSIALSRKGQDVGVVNQAIHQRCRQTVVPKHPIPLSKF